ARFEAPPGRAQVTDYRLDRHQAASAEIDRVVLVHRPHAMLVLRKGEVIIADVPAQHRLWKAREDTPEPAAMRRLLVGYEEIFQRRDAAREQLRQVPLDDWKVLWVPGLDQGRGALAGDEIGRIVAVIDLALVALRKAVPDPEHAGRVLAGHFVGHVSALLVAADVARHRHALIEACENIVEHRDVARHDRAAVQDATVARRDRLDV